MKFSNIFAIMLLFCVASVMATTFGDLNGDGVVTSADRSMMVILSLGGDVTCYNETGEIDCMEVADLNNNGEITEADLTILEEAISNGEEISDPSDLTTSTESCATLDICDGSSTMGYGCICDNGIEGDLDCNGVVTSSDISILRTLILNPDDCNSEYYPNADTDGNGIIDSDDLNDVTYITSLMDADNDGFTSDVDCNDNDASINPNATDICGNGIAENCVADLACPAAPSSGGSSGGSSSCEADWDCTAWSSCESNGIAIVENEAYEGTMTRTCESTNRCYKNMPEEEKSCIYYVPKDEQNNNDVTGNAVSDSGAKSDSKVFWLISLGIVILVAGGFLYFNTKK